MSTAVETIEQKGAAVTLTREQKDAKENILSHLALGERFMSLTGYAGTGKQQPIDRSVQTPDGPIQLGDLRVGDMVFGSNGQPTTVTGIFPQGVQQAWRVTFRDGSWTEAGEAHLWKVLGRPRSDRPATSKIVTTQELLSGGIRFKSGPHKWRVPLCSPVEYQPSEFFLHPYIVGALIGDGTDLGGTPTLSNPDSDRQVVERICALAPGGVRLVEDRSASCPRFRFVWTEEQNHNEVAAYLRSMGLDINSPDRFIPGYYLRSSVSQRWSLLRGLMDTDGSCRNNRTTFSTKSKRLAADLKTLVQSLGGTAILQDYVRERSGETEYQVNVKVFECPFRLERKAAQWAPSLKTRYITKIEPSREVEQVCISVEADDNLYLTDDFIVTHNTTLSANIIEALKEEDHEVYVCAPTHKAAHVLEEKGGYETRTIHSFLGLQLRRDGKGGYYLARGRESETPTSGVVLLDEASMVGKQLWQHIQSAPGLHWIFVGDPAQLPPVKEKPSPALNSPGAQLQEIVRQAKGNPILQVAMAVRKREPYLNKARHTGAAGVALTKSADGFIKSVVRGLESAPDHAPPPSRVLAYRNIVVRHYNDRVRRLLHNSGTRALPRFLAGDWLMMKESYRELDVTLCKNSEDVKVVNVDESSVVTAGGFWKTWLLTVQREGMPDAEIPILHEDEEKRYIQTLSVFKREAISGDREWRDYYDLKERFAEADYAFALTVHKSQGSTFETAYVDHRDLMNCRGPEKQALVYVACTRPSKQLALLI